VSAGVIRYAEVADLAGAGEGIERVKHLLDGCQRVEGIQLDLVGRGESFAGRQRRREEHQKNWTLVFSANTVP
jgi:hypothetical protein